MNGKRVKQEDEGSPLKTLEKYITTYYSISKHTFLDNIKWFNLI